MRRWTYLDIAMTMCRCFLLNEYFLVCNLLIKEKEVQLHIALQFDLNLLRIPPVNLQTLSRIKSRNPFTNQSSIRTYVRQMQFFHLKIVRKILCRDLNKCIKAGKKSRPFTICANTTLIP